MLFVVLFACAGCATQTAQVEATRTITFEIDMSDEIAAGRFKPRTDKLGVRGAQPPMSWQTTALAERVSEHLYRARIVFPKAPDGGQPVQYKFKIDREGFGQSDGWEEGRNRVVTLDLAQRTVARKWNAPGMDEVIQRTGHFEVIETFPSKHVAARTVQVWLPAQYASEPTRRFPVLYLHDGQMKFDAAEAGAEWQMDESAQRLIGRGEIAPFIMVAAHHSREQRILDYTPTASLLSAERLGAREPSRAGGGAPAYAQFLKTELKPMIDARYRTLPDRSNTAVGGASLGGLVSLWLALHHGDTFGSALVVSPSVWWDDEFATQDAAKVPTAQLKGSKIWLDMGAHEGEEALPAVRKLRQVLQDRVTLRYVEDGDGGHDEASWARRAPEMLKFLYGSK
jgi:predicted alpha/beta superfamily hydrolase